MQGDSRQQAAVAARLGSVLCVLLVVLASSARAWANPATTAAASLQRIPERIVTQSPALTEMVCALGECRRLVATDRYSDWPEEVKRLPKTGGLDDAAIERIVSLRPDLVLLANSARVTERLHSLGIRTLELDVRTVADINTSVTTLGRVLGAAERADALNARIMTAIDAVASGFGQRMQGRHPSVYYEVDAGPYAAGPGSYIGELLGRLGTRNIVDATLGPFPKLNPEYVVPHNPDVILIDAEAMPELGNRPGWNAIRAVRERRVCAFPRLVAETIMRPGPRVAEGLKAIADCISRVAP